MSIVNLFMDLTMPMDINPRLVEISYSVFLHFTIWFIEKFFLRIKVFWFSANIKHTWSVYLNKEPEYIIINFFGTITGDASIARTVILHNSKESSTADVINKLVQHYLLRKACGFLSNIPAAFFTIEPWLH